MQKLQYGPYSPSRLDTAECGFSFYKQYVDPDRKKRPRIEGVAAARGSAVHEVYERITAVAMKNLGQMPVPVSDSQLKMWVAEAVNRHPAAYPEIDEIVGMAKLYREKPPLTLTADAEIEQRLAVKWDPNATNSKGGKGDFVECSYDDPEAYARGRADILMFSDDGETALVYDHKTQPNVEEADTFQLGFYAWVIMKYYPHLQNVQTVLHFARYGKYSEPFNWSREQLEQIEDFLTTRVANIEMREGWAAQPNKNCQYCPFIAECPVMAEHILKDEQGGFTWNAQGLRILGDTQKAIQVAGFIKVVEEAKKLATKELKEHVKNAGGQGIALPGFIYEFRAEEAIHWDKVNKTELKWEIAELFEKHGIDAKKFMGFSQTFTSGVWLVTENKQLLDDLAAILPRKTSTEFGGFKV